MPRQNKPLLAARGFDAEVLVGAGGDAAEASLILTTLPRQSSS